MSQIQQISSDIITNYTKIESNVISNVTALDKRIFDNMAITSNNLKLNSSKIEAYIISNYTDLDGNLFQNTTVLDKRIFNNISQINTSYNTKITSINSQLTTHKSQITELQIDTQSIFQFICPLISTKAVYDVSQKTCVCTVKGSLLINNKECQCQLSSTETNYYCSGINECCYGNYHTYHFGQTQVTYDLTCGNGKSYTTTALITDNELLCDTFEVY
ncbi:Hypothetical_protein [Hexamita inflata]|uniref:Hypothetical_protein n=1 Tax=Hexamita inflata TaxID=28002 RepID=A0AA86QBX2_9EUKA|nr:Hypothetical protein HINF_LOCUS43565 [Hexamita inflata]